MGRIARIVVPDVPHHIIQRGNRSQQVFFNDNDKLFYLKLASEFAQKEKMDIWAYCLMDNHVHMIVVPHTEQSLANVFCNVHCKYTRRINSRYDWKGFLWQGRFISFPMDDRYTFSAVRYVERNPVRAGIVCKAEDYQWSSAFYHVSGIKNEFLLNDEPIKNEISDWKSYLSSNENVEDIKCIRNNCKNGLPLGDLDFIKNIESLMGRVLI